MVRPYMIDKKYIKARSSRRIRASLIDILLMISSALILFLPTIIYGFIYNLDTPNRSYTLLVTLSIVSTVVFVLGLFFYLVILPYFWNGQTIGKKIFSIKVINVKGKNATILDLFLREFFRLLIFILTLCLSLIVDLVIILLGKNKMSYYDVLSSTRVVEV